MLSKIKAIVPENLIFLAQKTPNMPVAIVCAHHKSSMESSKRSMQTRLNKSNIHWEKRINSKRSR